MSKPNNACKQLMLESTKKKPSKSCTFSVRYQLLYHKQCASFDQSVYVFFMFLILMQLLFILTQREQKFKMLVGSCISSLVTIIFS